MKSVTWVVLWLLHSDSAFVIRGKGLMDATPNVRNTRTERQIVQVLGPAAIISTCETMARALCVNEGDNEAACFQQARDKCLQQQPEIAIQEYSEITEVTEFAVSPIASEGFLPLDSKPENHTTASPNVPRETDLWNMFITCTLIFLLILTLALTVVLCWKNLQIDKLRKAVHGIEFKQR